MILKTTQGVFMNFKPLADNVFVKVSEAESTTASGLIMPTGSQKKPNYGEVLAVGSGTLIKDGTRIPIEVKVGEKVLFKKGAGVPMESDGEDYIVIREYDILGIV